MKPKIVILSGAGISAESGLKTFRDSGGLWEEHSIMDVATPEAWQRNPELVLRFYNERRKQLKTVKPNAAHFALVELEKYFPVKIITQNVDDLHERAGSKNIIHLHGELLKVRSERYPALAYTLEKDEIVLGDVCEKGFQLRPHIVWFGEEVPMIVPAMTDVAEADIIIVVGSSLNVYPAAGLLYHAAYESRKFLVDPAENQGASMYNLEHIKTTAGEGVPQLVKQLIAEFAEEKPAIS
ncbi:MAG: NAD-dependent deacylase [Bacteroidia bacterium]